MATKIIPNPDPTSRFPTTYCKTCGGGWPDYIRCDRWEWSNERKGMTKNDCDFTGEVAMTPEMQAVKDAFERGECEAGTRKLLPKDGWSVPKSAELDMTWHSETAQVDPNSLPGWGAPTKGK